MAALRLAIEQPLAEAEAVMSSGTSRLARVDAGDMAARGPTIGRVAHHLTRDIALRRRRRRHGFCVSISGAGEPVP